MQNENLKQKWVFLTWPNMALTNMGFKTKNWSHLEKDQTVEKRGEGEKKKKRKRKRRRREEKRKARPKRYGTNLGYGFYYGSYGFCMEF